MRDRVFHLSRRLPLNFILMCNHPSHLGSSRPPCLLWWESTTYRSLRCDITTLRGNVTWGCGVRWWNTSLQTSGHLQSLPEKRTSSSCWCVPAWVLHYVCTVCIARTLSWHVEYTLAVLEVWQTCNRIITRPWKWCSIVPVVGGGIDGSTHISTNYCYDWNFTVYVPVGVLLEILRSGMKCKLFCPC